MSDATDGDDGTAGGSGDAARSAVGFLRHGADVLLVRRRGAQGEDRGGRGADGATAAVPDDSEIPEAPDEDAWDAIRTAAGDPDAAIRRAVEAVVGGGGSATVELVRRGEPVRPEEPDAGERIDPYLFEFAGDREDVGGAAGGYGAADHEWVQPTALLDRRTAPGLWTAWRRVGPTVGTVRADSEHGAAYLSVRALEVLRDRAAALAAGAGGGRCGGNERDLPALATALIDARPGMAVVATRIDRVMTDAGGEAAAVRARAEDALSAAVAADGEAARTAADRVGALADAPAVLTLSRSG
ncbi:MAG: hypothetical protein ABEI11_02935, partial [Haloarculaceae archaeon]